MAKSDLTEYAREGFDQVPARYLESSAAWYAYHLGRHLYVTGRDEPHAVRMSRGYTIRANGLLFRHVGTCDGRQQFQRVCE